MDRELLKGCAPLLLLSMLQEGPLYGYQIIQTMRERTQGLHALQAGSLYPALRKLEAAGFVHSYWQSQPGGRDRCYYALLPAGEAHLEARKAEWARFVAMVDGFLGARNSP